MWTGHELLGNTMSPVAVCVSACECVCVYVCVRVSVHVIVCEWIILLK